MLKITGYSYILIYLYIHLYFYISIYLYNHLSIYTVYLSFSSALYNWCDISPVHLYRWTLDRLSSFSPVSRFIYLYILQCLYPVPLGYSSKGCTVRGWNVRHCWVTLPITILQSFYLVCASLPPRVKITKKSRSSSNSLSLSCYYLLYALPIFLSF